MFPWTLVPRKYVFIPVVTILKHILLPPAIRRMTEGYIFSLSTLWGRGPRSRWGGCPRSRSRWGGTWSQIRGCVGGYLVSGSRGGTQSQVLGGVPGLRSRGGGYPVSVKRKIFDTRFGLIHVQTGKFFLSRGPPPE